MLKPHAITNFPACHAPQNSMWVCGVKYRIRCSRSLAQHHPIKPHLHNAAAIQESGPKLELERNNPDKPEDEYGGPAQNQTVVPAARSRGTHGEVHNG